MFVLFFIILICLNTCHSGINASEINDEMPLVTINPHTTTTVAEHAAFQIPVTTMYIAEYTENFHWPANFQINDCCAQTWKWVHETFDNVLDYYLENWALSGLNK